MNTLHLPLVRFSILLALCLLGFGLLWWFTMGSGRFARRRRLRRHVESFSPPSTPSEYAALAGMRGAVARSRDPLYEIPWFLFIGDDAADVSGLLSTACAALPAPFQMQPDATSGSFWRWWSLPSMTAIETQPQAVHGPETERMRNLWHRALMELVDQRDRLPLNGIVVCVSAASLLGDPRAVSETAARLRHKIDEAGEHLRLHLPVYLVVTGLERLRGFDIVQSALPPAVLAQALGHRLPDSAAQHAGAARTLDTLFDPIAVGLHALRMGLLRSQQDPSCRQAVHAFVEQVRAMQPALRVVAERLFDDARHARAARWRGLYLTAASTDTHQGAFVSDLFSHFLPSDQPLAHA